jgi:flagellar hook protein FlgE
MSLSSVMQVGLSGTSAAELTLDAVGNNLANLNTPGYKQSFPRFATQTPATQSLGHPPGGSSAGTNPVQIGRGVQLAEVVVDFTQGSLVASSNSSDLAIEGEGFFILQTAGGERAYTRNGQFRINGQQRLVTAGGDFVLGFGVDGDGNVVEGPLVRLEWLEFSDTDAQGADGSAARLMSFTVGGDGRILGRYSDGVTRTLGKLPLARFANPTGLISVGASKYIEGPNSGAGAIFSADDPGAAAIAAGIRELSNTDLGGNLIAMLLARNQYRAHWQVVGTASELLDDLIQLRRR